MWVLHIMSSKQMAFKYMIHFVLHVIIITTGKYTCYLQIGTQRSLLQISQQNCRFPITCGNGVYRTQVLVLSECGFESRHGWSWRLCP